MTWVAAVLGIFLFYYFVDRRHKMAVFRGLALLAVLGSILTSSYHLYDYYEQKQRATWLTVGTPTLVIQADAAQTAKLVEQAWQDQKLSEKVASLFPNISAAERRVLGGYFWSSNFPRGVESNSYDSTNVNDDFVRSFDEFIEALEFAYSGDDIQRIKFCTKDQKVDKFVSRLKLARAEHKNLAPSTILSISKALIHCNIPDLKKELLPEERALQESIPELSEIARARLRDLVNFSSLTTEIHFNVCNRRSFGVNRYSFEVSGFQAGRSTPKTLYRTPGSSVPTKFDSDIIIGPNTCAGITYSGLYNFFPRYVVTNIEGTWQDNKTT